MTIALNLKGVRYSRLLVVKRVPKPDNLKRMASYWLCLCDCGNEKVVMGIHLVSGHTLSCGCYMKEMATKNLDGLSEKNITHGMSGTPFYEVWKKMKHRCYNENNKNFHNYGGRGITVSSDWKVFEKFKEDMYQEYLDFNNTQGSQTATLERVNNDGNYCKENCSWVTIQQQQLNKKRKMEEN